LNIVKNNFSNPILKDISFYAFITFSLQKTISELHQEKYESEKVKMCVYVYILSVQ